MNRKILLFFIVCASLLFFACGKEASFDSTSGRTSNADLPGTFKFISLHVIAQTVVERKGTLFNMKTITNTGYLTKDILHFINRKRSLTRVKTKRRPQAEKR